MKPVTFTVLLGLFGLRWRAARLIARSSKSFLANKNEIIMKRISLNLLATLVTAQAHAAPGWMNSAPPTAVEVVRTQGLLILGAFGNPGTACTNPDGIWVDVAHPQYQTIVATATTAVATGLKLRAYVHDCTAIGWHGGTYNELTGDGAIFLEK